MHFEGGINRPPYEAASGFLQVTTGCSHNACAFCSYFKTDRFTRVDLAQIEADAKEITRTFGPVRRVFLQSADAFSAGYDTLMRTAEFIHEHAPHVAEIGGYARIDNFCDMSVQQVRDLVEAGYKDPYIGVESGDDALLESMRKGYDAACAREQLEKLDAAGMAYIVNFINGLGGAGYGLGHARATAALYSGLHPSVIDISSLVLVPGTGLWHRAQKGKYAEAGEMERLEELKEFVRLLDNECAFQAEHISVPFQVRCELPEAKQDLLDGIQRIIDGVSEERLRDFRVNVASRGY